ncbi:outer membrane protein assembly factor [Flavobacterium sp. K5-23]|uniref:outer membrane protein assembly factor n=1 Tax=Flavobacterium sp. K5-23 TaxID=2746225 RepID=UPI00200DFC50|nr:outer membrane protein assembly factor [Flavobacterium sp. K5-23]UQD57345.1 outer membrane protein assembly factor [Flavobacterium sp. K5-23]
MKYIHLLLWLFTSISYSQSLTIDKTAFLGTKRLDKSFLEKLIYSKSGVVLDSIQLNNDVQILNRLNGVSKAEFSVIKKAGNLVDINFIISENITLIPNASVWTTDEIGSYRIGIYESNFLGKNNGIGGFYQYNGFHSYGLNFRSPQFFSPKYGIEINLQKLISKEPVYFSNQAANYQYTNSSAEMIGNYRINIKNEIRVGIAFLNEKYNYLDGATSSSIPQFLAIDKKLLKLEYRFDNVTYDYYLAKGFRSNLYTQLVISENEFQDKFVIGWNDFLFYKRVGKSGNWASRLRLGLSTNNESPFAPFSVDNNVNLRGVGYIIDRGTGSVVFNTEFRKTLFEKKWFVLQGNAFVDSGTWRLPGGDFSDFVAAKNIRIYPGLGLRFIHKSIFNAVFRFDYGYGITENASKGFVFGIGQYF